MQGAETVVEKKRQKQGHRPPKSPRSLCTRWGDGSGGYYIKVPAVPACRPLIGKYRREVGEPMAIYYAKGGGVLAYQWRVRA